MASIQRRQGKRGTTYRVMWRTPEGGQRSRTLADAAAARRLCAEMALAEQRGRGPDPRAGDITLAEWASDVIGAKPLKPKTRATYEELLTKRILPAFGAVPLRDIERPAIRQWVTSLGREVSPRRTQNAFALLRHLLDEAVAEERLPRNPALRIRLPRHVRKDVEPWTFQELTAVADASGRYRSLVLWLGLMGTRWAETIGLRPSDFGPDEVAITSTLSEVRGVFHRVPTKTYATRLLPVPDGLIGALPSNPDELIFASPKGFPLRSAQFRDRHFLRACEAAGVRPIRIHHLRHTAASLLAQQGAAPTTIQQWLGHQDIRVTMNTYTHAFPQELRLEAARIANRLTSHQR